MNKVKEFFEEHKTEIAVATSLIAGIAIGGTVMYVKHGKYRELEKQLEKYIMKTNGMTLAERITSFMKRGPFIWYVSGGENDTVANMGECMQDVYDAFEEIEHLDNKFIGAVVFTKE